MEKIRLTKSIEILPSLNKIAINHPGRTQSISIENQLMKILLLLVNHKGQLVTKAEFIDRIWEGNQAVGEQALTKNIFKLRKTLNEADGTGHIQIQTIPKKGYCLVVQSEEVPYKNNRKQMAVFAFLSVILLLGVLRFFKNDKSLPPNQTEVFEYDETANDTIIHLGGSQKVQVIKLDSMEDKVIYLE